MRMAIQSTAIKCARMSKRSCNGRNGRNGKLFGRQTGDSSGLSCDEWMEEVVL
jgi:hypothetical protein